MSQLHRITINPEQCSGRPCIRSTRNLLAPGASREEILQDFPYPEAEDITAALEYAARQTGHAVLRVV